jgi:hypothetical protein
MGGNARGMVDVEAPTGSGSFTAETLKVGRMEGVATQDSHVMVLYGKGWLSASWSDVG